MFNHFVKTAYLFFYKLWNIKWSLYLQTLYYMCLCELSVCKVWAIQNETALRQQRKSESINTPVVTSFLVSTKNKLKMKRIKSQLKKVQNAAIHQFIPNNLKLKTHNSIESLELSINILNMAKPKTVLVYWTEMSLLRRRLWTG